MISARPSSQHLPDQAVTVIATLPPPTTGMTSVTERMVRELSLQGPVAVINLSAGSGAGPGRRRVIRSLRQLWASLRVLMGRAGTRNIYIALNSGSAIVLDIILVAAARARKRRVFAHHHSFRFVSSQHPLLRALYRVGGEYITDIALCDHMARLLESHYGRTHTRVVPNLVTSTPVPTSLKPDGSVKLGHLSNLSIEKGVGRTVDAFARACAQGLDVELHLAGPFASKSAQDVVKAAQLRWPDAVFYHGPLYGSDKDRFYSSLDVFLYPTDYEVEAQPLVLLEALVGGASVIATKRGCIGELARSEFTESVTVCDLKDFSATVTDRVAKLTTCDATSRADSRLMAKATAVDFTRHARQSWDSLITEISDPYGASTHFS